MVVVRYAAELRPEGVIVLALSPGLVDTSLDNPKKQVESK